MNIAGIWRDIKTFMSINRGSGTTTLIKKIANENDVFVLVPSDMVGKMIGKSAVNINKLNNIRGLQKKPILLDNFTLIELTNKTIEELQKLNGEICKRDDLIKEIYNLIRKSNYV